MSVRLSRVESLRLCSVLQDCADQLAVLGHVMPDTYKCRLEADLEVCADIGGVLKQQKGAENPSKAARQFQGEAGGLLDARRDFHRSQKELKGILEEENPMAPDNLAEVQSDKARQFVACVLADVLEELQEKGVFSSLLLAVEEKKRRKAQLLDIIIREEESRRKTKALQRQLLDIKKEKALELQQREEMTALLKDQLQEVKAKTGLEQKYVKSSADLLEYQGQKLNAHSENQLADEIRLLHDQLEEERRVQMKMGNFLKELQMSMGEKLTVWVERYERDMEDERHKLNTLRNNKANNLIHLQELARRYRYSEQVVIEDRMEKENQRMQLEREQLEWVAVTKLQAWWRGNMVRRGLGPYKKGKKPKSKDGKKGKKKKK